MKMYKSYAVLGLGRYGMSVAETLAENGADVLAVDSNIEIVNEAAEKIPLCKCADITDISVLKELGIENIDVVIISMASDLESTILTTSLCKELGVSKIIVKSSNEMHKKILLQIGADEVVIPEKESGVRIAKNLLHSNCVDIMEVSKDVSIIELDMKEEWINKTVIDINFRKKYGINIIAIRDGNKVHTNIKPDLVLTKSMKLIVVIRLSQLKKLVSM